MHHIEGKVQISHQNLSPQAHPFFFFVQIISTPQCKAFICDGCKAKIDEHYQFKMQCIRNVNLQRFNNGSVVAVAETPGSTTEGSEPSATTSALVEAIPTSSKVD